jgi:membrane protein DedA with SNARE-associated domain
MNLGALIETHGYWALAAGCALEGETMLVLAGLAAQRGYLDPFAVVVIAAGMAFTGDQIFFWIGRRHGAAVLARWPSIGAKAGRVHALIERYHLGVIIGVRFAYGLRIAGPILIGTSAVSALRFAVINAIGAVLWACIVGGIGWLSGAAAETVFGDVKHLEKWLFLCVLVIAALAWLIHKMKRPEGSRRRGVW